MRLLNELADNETLKRVRGAATTDDEQESDRELILRFFAMHGHMRAYRMPLSNFLNDEADRGAALGNAALQQRRALFERAIGNVRMRSACAHAAWLSMRRHGWGLCPPGDDTGTYSACIAGVGGLWRGLVPGRQRQAGAQPVGHAARHPEPVRSAEVFFTVLN